MAFFVYGNVYLYEHRRRMVAAPEETQYCCYYLAGSVFCVCPERRIWHNVLMFTFFESNPREWWGTAVIILNQLVLRAIFKLWKQNSAEFVVALGVSLYRGHLNPRRLGFKSTCSYENKSEST